MNREVLDESMKPSFREAKRGLDVPRKPWRFPVWSIAVCLLLGILVMHLMPIQYLVQMVVGPVANSNGGQSQLADKLGGLGELTSLVGVDITQGSKQFQVYLHLLTTPDLVAVVQENEDFMQKLFSGTWDASSKTWKRPVGVKASLKMGLNWVFNRPTWLPPTVVSTSEYLADQIQIVSIRTTGLQEISITSRSSVQAIYILQTLTQGVDDFLRAESVQRQGAYLKYLYSRLGVTTETEQRKAISHLILKGERELMLAQSGLSYAGDVIVEPHVLTRPLGPSPVLILFMSILIGLGASYVLHRTGFDEIIERKVKNTISAWKLRTNKS